MIKSAPKSSRPYALVERYPRGTAHRFSKMPKRQSSSGQARLARLSASCFHSGASSTSTSQGQAQLSSQTYSPLTRRPAAKQVAGPISSSGVTTSLSSLRSYMDLVERTRSAGIAIIIGVQTVASFGDAADRLLQISGTVITHRTPLPDSVVELAGTVQVWEDSQVVDGLGVRIATSGRLQQQCRVPPDLARSLKIGEAVLIQGG